MDRLLQQIALGFVAAFRVSAVAVCIMLLVFPAFKGVWLGYAPIAVGGVLLFWVVRVQQPLSKALMQLSAGKFILLLCAIPAIAQVALIFIFRSEPVFDGFFVYCEAKTWAESGGINPLTYYAPGQIWYYAMFFRLFGPSVYVAQLCQIPLAALIPVVSWRIARYGVSEDRARMVAALIAIYPGLLLYILVTPYYFYLYMLMILLIVWSWLRVLNRSDTCAAPLWGGLAAGWGALTKPTLLVAPLQTLFFWMVAGGTFGHRRRWLACLMFTVVMAAVIAPWTMRNKRVFGEPVLINTSGPLVFYSANNPESDGLYSPIPDQAQLESPADMLAHMAYCNEQAWAFIREQPTAFARLVWLKLLHTWGTETTFVELINFSGASLGVFDPLLRFIVQIGWAALVIAWMMVAMRAVWLRIPPHALEISAGIFVLSKFLVYSVYEGGARHHMPVIPLLIVYIAVMMSAHELWCRDRKKSIH